ncbi:amino acid ABC transporter ATP-binding protein [Oscillatoriales cyanobacterium LEGE 11467]|uniref:Amino acid ABC transporter ATP-binding protein n=1 Tax=Zarconia navalis LEGE 11467 TaxID=1828826 RepID=A0A928W1L0_9CYAN|nr:ATP-binding cassette domain-containing protein [Zarconia navalis]MBE9042223.1 amino acid ABC transporter ATP-binding protein [Zarconia navalis LEGE 11467]
MHSSFLSIENLGKRFSRGNILEDVSFSLEKGESLLIQGKSGCGKTTLLRCIALLEAIDRGQIVFNGNVVSKPGCLDRPNSRLEIGMVFQQLYLWSHMTVLENVALPLWLRRDRHKNLADEVAKYQLAQLGIEDKANEYPNQLSGGQRQRAALARALVHSPKLLLLDEITANLDPETAYNVVGIVEKIIEAGTSVIWVTHSDLPSTIWSYILRFENGTWIKDKYH